MTAATRARVTAIICVRNGALRIGRAVASIRAQSRPVDEVVLVDGHSTDGTPEAAGPGVRTVLQQGDGLAAARNTGIDAATGDVIAFLDHDDRWTPDKLAIQLALLDGADAPLAAVGHLIFVEDTEEGRPVPGPRGLPRLGRTPGTLLAHRRAFDRVGRFDPALGMGCDMDWFVRAGDAGVPIAAAPEVVLRKAIRADALSADPSVNKQAALAVLARRRARGRA